MKRRHVLLLAAVAVMIGVVAIAQIKKSELLLLQWAKKAPAEAPPIAVLIEMGLKDAKPRAWDGRAVVTGAKVVHREGYRFREGDKLVEPDAWTASMVHDLTALPSTWTTQAPHCEVSQPTCVPVSPRCSLRK